MKRTVLLSNIAGYSSVLFGDVAGYPSAYLAEDTVSLYAPGRAL